LIFKIGINPDFEKDKEARMFRLKPLKISALRAFQYSLAGPRFQPGPGNPELRCIGFRGPQFQPGPGNPDSRCIGFRESRFYDFATETICAMV
jgi:hypothetical protein